MKKEYIQRRREKVKSCAKKLNYCLTIPFLIVTHIALRFTLPKAPNRSKHPNAIHCGVNVRAHTVTYINTHTYIYHKGTQYYRN